MPRILSPSATIAGRDLLRPAPGGGPAPVAAAVTYTRSGYTSLRAARERPAAPILSMSAELGTARRMAAGVGRALGAVREITGHRRNDDHASETAHEEGFAQTGDVIAIAAGMPFGVAGTTNLLKLVSV